MKLFYIILNVLQCNTAYAAYRSCEVFVNYVLGYTDCFKNLGALIRLNRGNTHLGGNFYNATDHSVIIVFHCSIVIFVQHMCVNKLMDSLKCQIRVHCTCAIAKKCCEVMNLSWLSGFQNNSKGSTLFCFYKVLMYCGNGKERRNRHVVFVHSSVRKHQNVGAISVGFINLHKQAVNGTLQLRALII